MAMPDSGQWFAGYLLGDVLGEGDLGIVYRALPARAQAPVAVKIFRAEATGEAELSRRLESERRTMALAHPHLVRVLDVGVDNGRPYSSMQLVDGPTLRAVLNRPERPDRAWITLVVTQIAGALGAIHGAGFVHRNVTPENILLEQDLGHPHAYLADFSLSRDPSADHATNVGVLVGSHAYLAPEQVIGVDEVDPRTDVYALGCVAYEALVGRTPFADDNPAVSLLRRTSQRPPPPSAVRPELGPAWDEALLHALSTGPDDRFSTAAEFALAFSTAGSLAPE